MHMLMHTLARRVAAALATLGAAVAASAHPGHGDHEAMDLLATLIHPLQPHQAFWLLAAAAVAARAFTGRRGNWLLFSAVGASGLALLVRG